MKTFFSLVISFFFVVLFSGVASAADCSKQIVADEPYLGLVSTVTDVHVTPVNAEEATVFGPGRFKYNYTVLHTGTSLSFSFSTYSVHDSANVPLRGGAYFAWVPVDIATDGRVINPGYFVPTAYSPSDCKPIALDISWSTEMVQEFMGL